jgi:PAS domain S-box-containing protein
MALNTGDENPAGQTRKPLFQTLAVNVPGIVYRVYVREQNRMQFFNHMLEEMTGYKPNELKKGDVCSIDPMILSEDLFRVLGVVKDAVADNKLFEVEYRIRHKNGSIRHFLERGRPVQRRNGKPEFIDGVILDITERKKAQEALVFKEHIIENSSSFIATCDLEGNMTYGNPSFLKRWGFADPEEFLGKPFWKFWLVEDRLEEIMQALRGDGFWFDEIKAIRKDGATFDVQVSAAMVFDGDGKPFALTSTSIDITERKRAERALRQARDELEQRVVERTAELERSNRELQDFAFIASHDLQEPLRKIRAFGEMIVRGSGNILSEQSLDYLARMNKAVSRMHELLTSLLDYSRVTTKAAPFKRINLNQSVEASLSNLEILIRENRGHVEVGPLPTLEAEPVQMVQLFQNLIGNALKFRRSPEAPFIRIYANPGASGKDIAVYQILIEDNGIGFDEKDLAHIFVPFHRLHGRSTYEGVGMGLAICKKIVGRHGGEITAKSKLGKGSTFILTLPAKQKEKD